MQRFMNVAENIMGNTNLPPVFHYRVATLLERGGRFPEMIRALDMCIDKLPADAPPEIFLDIANKYREANQPDKMLLVIQKYLQRKPKDWSAWLDLGLVNMGLGRTNEARSEGAKVE